MSFDTNLVSDIIREHTEGYEKVRVIHNMVSVYFPNELTASFAVWEDWGEDHINGWYARVFHRKKNYPVHDVLFPCWDNALSGANETAIDIKRVPEDILEFTRQVRINDGNL